jgi:heat shock protein HslJ
MQRATALVLLGFALASCSGPLSPAETDILGIVWKLRSIQRPDEPTLQISNPDRFTVQFGEDHQAAIRADCNVCTGRYDLNGSTLQLGPLACTRAFCGVESPDTIFLRGLELSISVSTLSDMLKLTSTRGTLVFER